MLAAEMARNSLSADDLKDVIAGALSSVLSQVSSIGQGSNAHRGDGSSSSSNRRDSEQHRHSHGNQDDDDYVAPLPPPLPISRLYGQDTRRR